MDPRTESVTYPANCGKQHYPETPDRVPDSPSRMLDRMEKHAEFLVHLGNLLENVLDRIHGPVPEQMSKASGVEPNSTMAWQADKMESQARRLSDLIETLENSI